MNVELSTEVNESVETALDERVETTALRPWRVSRMLGVAFGFCCYMAFAALYFLRPTNPVISFGQARFTIDALLEVTFTLLALPAFGMAYFYGIRHHEKSPDFTVPEFTIDVLFVVALAWVAIGNGIHLTAKLNEQIVSSVNDGQLVGVKSNFHWIRQVVGHVFPHIGWQVLFAALMLGQLKRPYMGCKPRVIGFILWDSFWVIICPRRHCRRLHSYRICPDGYLLPRLFLFRVQSEIGVGRTSDPELLFFRPSHVSPYRRHLLGCLPQPRDLTGERRQRSALMGSGWVNSGSILTRRTLTRT